MAGSETYFQFPLCLLSYPCKTKKRVKYIVDYGIGYYARHLMEYQDGDFSYISQSPNGHFHPLELEEKSARLGISIEATLFYLTATLMGVSISSSKAERRLMRYLEAHEYQREFENRHGKDAFVRIRKDIAEDVFSTLPMREFSVLCAIYSKIGDKGAPVQITTAEILLRARGFKSRKVAKMENARLDPLALTESKVRGATKTLFARGFFSRTTFGQRQTYYSHRMDIGELRKAVIALKLSPRKREGFLRDQARDDRKMTEEIRILRKAA